MVLPCFIDGDVHVFEEVLVEPSHCAVLVVEDSRPHIGEDKPTNDVHVVLFEPGKVFVDLSALCRLGKTAMPPTIGAEVLPEVVAGVVGSDDEGVVLNKSAVQTLSVVRERAAAQGRNRTGWQMPPPKGRELPPVSIPASFAKVS